GPPPGVVEMGVCHYESHPAVDGNDLPLYSTRTFAARMPDGPLSHEGKAVVIRWVVRLRLRYVNGDEAVTDLPFRLGPTDRAPVAESPPPSPAATPPAGPPPPPVPLEKTETPEGVRYRLPKAAGMMGLGFVPVLAVVAAVPVTPAILAALFLVGNAAELSWPQLVPPWLFVAQMVFLALVPVRLFYWSLLRGAAQALGRN